MEFKYSLIAVIDHQEFRSENNTKEEFNNLLDMIESRGGWLVEYTAERINKGAKV